MKQHRIVQGNPSFDPQHQQAVQANHGLLPLQNEMLTPLFIQQSFNTATVSDMTQSLDPIIQAWNSEKRIIHERTPYAEAATLMPLVQTDQGLEMLLTKRALHLKKHSGQISFPGGRIDKSDLSAEQAALRETLEEVGIAAEYIQILGQLPDFFTGTGFVMKPFVAYLNPDYVLNINHDEVDEVFSVPLSFVLNPNNHFLHQAPIENGVLRQYYSIPWQNYFIWGATAAVIRNFYYHLKANI